MRWLTTLTVLGVCLGAGAGMLCQATGAPDKVVEVISYPGRLFVRALKIMVTPMIFSSMVTSTSTMREKGGANAMSRMALKFYLSTTFVAATEGILLFNVFSAAFTPQDASRGSAAPTPAVTGGSGASTGGLLLDTALKFGLDLVPDNLGKALVDNQLLGVITFAIFFGAMLPASPDMQLVVRFFGACFDTCVAMIQVIIFATPVGVGSLVAGSIARQERLLSALGNLGALMGVVFLGQLLHVFGFYAATYLFLTRRNPLRYFAGLPRMWMTAFGTSSSAATLSTTIQCCEELGVSREAINFILPIGCTVNMDGSALERPIVVLWIAYMAGLPIPFSGQLVVAMTSSLLSIGGSPIPSAGISTLVVMVEAAGVALTPEVEMYVAFCLAVEWLFDSVRTCVNVTGDSIGVAIIDHLCDRSAGAVPEDKAVNV